MIDPAHRDTIHKIARTIFLRCERNLPASPESIAIDIENHGGPRADSDASWEDRLLSWIEILVEDSIKEEK